MYRILMIGIMLVLLLLSVGAIASAQGDGDDAPIIIDAPTQAVVAQGVFDEVGAWADATWKTAGLFAIQVMVIVSALKTFLWTFAPGETEDRLKSIEVLGLRVYNLALLAVIFAVSWVMVVSNFDWHPFADSPLPGLSGLDANLQNAMTAALITVAAGVAHEITTGIGAFFRYLKTWIDGAV